MTDDVLDRYFDAWNRGRDDTFAAIFATSGTYCDPMTGGPIPAAALPGYAGRLRAMLPDLRFEIGERTSNADGVHAVRWRMLGTNTGSFQGLPPTGKAVDVPGVDVFRVVDGRIVSVDGYFDAGAVPRQLGLQIVVQPVSVGPFEFGTATRVAGRDAVPGAISVTVIEGRSEEDFQRITDLTRATAQSMTAMKGFIGLTTARIGLRGMTVSTWETPADVEQIHRGPHAEAMRAFWTTTGAGGFTTVWSGPKLNANWIRCPACAKMARHDGAPDARCGCGETLPAPIRWG